METHLAEIAAKLLAYVEATESFVVQEAPMVVQEILNYAYLSAIFDVVVGTILLPVAWVLVQLARRHAKVWREKEEEHKDNEGHVILVGASSLCAAFTLLGGLVTLGAGLYHLLYVVVCPRLVIIEYLQASI